MTLTKADLVQQVYKAHPTLTKSQSTESVETFLTISKTSLITGQDLLLSGFGKFNIKDKKSRRGRNPQTGSELTLDAIGRAVGEVRGHNYSTGDDVDLTADEADLELADVFEVDHPGLARLDEPLLESHGVLLCSVANRDISR